jgi:F-type H+-transporting ATPase subunit c
MRFTYLLLAAVAGLLATASPAFAQAGTSVPGTLGPGLGAGVGMGLAIVGIGIGIGLIGHSALSGIARQPEQAGAIQGVMFILAGLVEGAGIIALVLCLLLPLIV